MSSWRQRSVMAAMVLAFTAQTAWTQSLAQQNDSSPRETERDSLSAPPSGVEAEALPPPIGVTPSPGQASLGIVVVDVSPETQIRYGQVVRRGAVVTQVRNGSPASRAGLPIGGVIVAFDGQRVDSANDLVNYVRSSRSGREAELTFYQGRQLIRRTVRLSDSGEPAIRIEPGPPPRPFIPSPGPDLLDPAAENADFENNPQTDQDLRRQIQQLQEAIEQLSQRVSQLEARLPAPPPPPKADND